MAATKVLSVEDRLKNIFDLQKIDSQIDEIKILKGELPIEVEDLDDEVQGLETRVAKLVEKMDELNTEISNHKKNIATAETLIERYKTQLDDVKNNREFEALSKEIELQELEIKLSEKKMREIDASSLMIRSEKTTETASQWLPSRETHAVDASTGYHHSSKSRSDSERGSSLVSTAAGS